ncbi:MAG TPA: WecB/TagA/CpsF family glycosyltransferase [Chthoniobacteraceae bacterium]|nr:WecB/TagA/CpsF family glycosyltransferase [Chthoniobacteraceae bacterium]
MFSTPQFTVIGTPLLATTYDALRTDLLAAREAGRGLTIDFTNTHIVTERKHDPAFRKTTEVFDAFVPDGMPLIWCINAQGAGLRDRVYGPTFTRKFLESSPADVRHYFLGGSSECLEKLTANMRALNPGLNIVGAHHGYFKPDEDGPILEDIRAKKTEFLWVGLGTPKQQEWIAKHRAELPGVIILAVGFAFDVNAGTKKDAPMLMQRLGLTWLYRMLSEPRRLFSRYLKYNALFISYLLLEKFRPKPAT